MNPSSLRTRFEYRDETLIQVVQPGLLPMMPIFDLSADPLPQQIARRAALCEEQRQARFDLTRDSPFRISLIKSGREAWHVCFTFHHIIADGWSISLFLQQLEQGYAAYRSGRGHSVAVPVATYLDYSRWQHETLRGPLRETLTDYWRQRLQGAPRVHGLPLDRPRSAQPSLEGGIVRSRLDPEATTALKAFLAEQNASLFMGLKGLFCALIARFSGERDIVIGTVIANRPHVAWEDVFGYFAGTLVLRQQLEPGQDLAGLVGQARETFLADDEHRLLPFEQVVDALQPERTLAEHPLFQIMLVLQNATAPATSTGSSLFESEEQGGGASPFDLTLAVREEGAGLVLAWRYATELFERTRIEHLAEAFNRLIKLALANPSADVHCLPILPAQEIVRLQAGASPPPRRFADAGRPVHALIADHASRTPDALAVGGNCGLTYAGLERLAHRLAVRLQAAAVGPGDIVGLLLPPSPMQIVAMLATLKAGAAFLAMDPSQPALRVRGLIEQAGIEHVLHDGAANVRELQCDSSLRLMVVDEAFLQADGSGDSAQLQADVAWTPASPAYAVHTSGSTGQPKAVVLHHGGLVNHVLSQRELFGVTDGSRVMQYAAPAFDVAVCEIFLALCSGARVDIADPQIRRDPVALGHFIESRRITHVLLIPSVLAALSPERLRSVQTIVVGGESISEAQARQWSHGHRLFNAYGPSEATICAVAGEYTGGPVRIGWPIDNMAAYVVDDGGLMVPEGAPGELLLGGVGLALGYLGQASLTSERFIEHVFEDGTRKRLYRTGDCVRKHADGQLEFLGRIDEQLKIRGVRVEPGEICSALQACEGVGAAAVLAQPLASGDKQLVAYVVLDGTISADGWRDRLRAQLRRYLPASLMPDTFVELAAIPVLANGKLDRKALPPAGGDEADTAASEPPLSDTEQRLCEVMGAVLGRPVDNVLLDFFQAGGNSLLAMKLMARLEAQLGIVLPLPMLFDARSVRQLAACIDTVHGAAQPPARLPIVPSASQQAPLTFQQARIWFLSRIESVAEAYHGTRCLAIEGELDAVALERALQQLLQRHQVLRTVIIDSSEGPLQQVRDDLPLVLAREDVSMLIGVVQQQRIDAIVQQAASQPFDLAQDLMLRACLVRRAPQQHVLVLTLHHIACDGWSMAVLTRELNVLYAAGVAGVAATLPPLPVQYRDYAHWQHAWLQGPALAQARDYWLRRLQGLPEVHALPLDRPRPVQPSYRGEVHRQVLPAALRHRLEALAQRHQATLFMTLQAAFALLLGRLSDEQDIVLGTAIANREQAELADLIGLFANTLVLRTQLQPEQRFDALLEQTRQHLVADFAHQQMPFEVLVEALNPTRQLSHNPLFQIMLLWQNNEQASLDLGEGLHFTDYPLPRAVSKFDLTLTVQEAQNGGLALAWRYATDLFDAQSMVRWADALQCLLEGIVDDPGQRVGRLPVLAEADRRLLQQWQSPTVVTGSGDSLHQRFARQAALTPQAVAVTGVGGSLSYAELDARADRLAAWLQREGAGPGAVVGVCAERHVELLVALLGVLKAGAAYLPLDPDYPLERLQYMVSDAGAGWLVGDRHCLQPWVGQGIACLPLDALDHAIDAYSPLMSHATAMAYVIYTSGSTGQPKGVVIRHEAIMAFLDSADAVLEGDVSYRWVAVTPVSFDISVLELFLPLTRGGTVLLADRATAQDGAALASWIERGQANVLQATPMTWKLLREAGWSGQSGLKLLVGGEYVPQALGDWLATCGVGVWNCYGPTESTVWTHMQRFARDGRCIAPAAELGGCLAHVAQCVVDQYGEPSAIGGVGELWLGGLALAEGYWQRPALSAERFVECDLGNGRQRWYRTGDRVQWLAGGRLRFLGRIDQQVKLRGHRIELGEIEHCLLGLEGVADAVVVLRSGDSDEPQLAAYVVLAPGQPLPAEDGWQAHLLTRLPAYMHPSSLTVLEALPLTANGKIDRRALPAPQHAATVADELPASETEQRLAALWCELLGVPSVGVTRSFFQLGGHSLLAARLVARISSQWGVQLPLRVVFEQPSVRALAQWLQAAQYVELAGGLESGTVSDEVII